MRRQAPDRPAPLDGGVILPTEEVSLDLEAFDTQVRAKGVPLIHYRALRCPVGLTDPSDARRTHEDHSGCSNGFLFKPVGRVVANLTSNSAEVRQSEVGYFDGSTVMATFPRYYDSDQNKRVLVRPYDRFSIDQDDILTGTWDLTKRRLDASPDRFEFPAVQVEHLVDANNVWYQQNIDFDLVGGDLVWRPGRGCDIGTVYSVWYTYSPYWIVERLVHEVRLYPTRDFVSTDDVRMERLGFAAILQREYVHRTQAPDDQAPNKQRQQKLPPDLDEMSNG